MQLFLLILLWMFHITQVSVIQLIKIPHPCLLVEETKLYPIFEGLPVPEPDEGLTSCLRILRFIDEVVWGLRAPRQRQQLQYARPNRHPVQYIKVIGVSGHHGSVNSCSTPGQTDNLCSTLKLLGDSGHHGSVNRCSTPGQTDNLCSTLKLLGDSGHLGSVNSCSTQGPTDNLCSKLQYIGRLQAPLQRL